MKLKAVLTLTLGCVLAFAPIAHAQFTTFSNQGLVGVGRIPANSFDTIPNSADTLGGVFSAMTFDQRTLQRSGEAYSGTLYGLPDRGFGDGAQDFRPRVQRFAFSITPYYGTNPTGQNQITLLNNQTTLLTYPIGINSPLLNFTGFDANDTTSNSFPRSAANSLGQGRRSLDPEGIVLRTSDNGFWISDEYGGFVYRFNANGALVQTLSIPAALIPRTGAVGSRVINFTGASAPAIGRNNNRGLEGLTITPDGTRLVAMLQSPTVQDSAGGSTNNSLNTRILVYDVEAGSATENQLIGEYVYVLTNQGSAAGRSTPISEIYAINGYQFLILERDNIGFGGTDGAPRYKKVNLADISAATNIAGTGYDLEAGTAGALSLPALNLTGTGIVPAARRDFVDIIDAAQLAKFSLNATAARDQNSLAEKWEGLELLSVREQNAPNDYLLLVGNDNDFKAATVFHNGTNVGTNNPTVDTMLLAYRVTLPISRQTAVRKRDFDRDDKSDFTIFRNGVWYVLNSATGTVRGLNFGLTNDVPAAADYDGDDAIDFAVFRDGVFIIQNNQTGAVRYAEFGLAGDIPVPADYDGDGKADVAVYRPSNSSWYFLNSSNNAVRSIRWGNPGDVPVVGDFDGDAKTDIVVWRPSNGAWFSLLSRDGGRVPVFGVNGDIPAAGDYDGDGKTDLAVFRPSNGVWYLQQSRDGFAARQWGLNGDTPVTGDYDNDGRNDVAVFRGGDWYVLNSSNNSFTGLNWGLSGDVPIR